MTDASQSFRGEFYVATPALLHSEFRVGRRYWATLKGEMYIERTYNELHSIITIRHSNSSNLRGELLVVAPASVNNHAEFTTMHSASVNLHTSFIVMHYGDLLNIITLRHTATVNLKGELFVGIQDLETLYSRFIIINSGSANLGASIRLRQGVENLRGELIIRRDSWVSLFGANFGSAVNHLNPHGEGFMQYPVVSIVPGPSGDSYEVVSRYLAYEYESIPFGVLDSTPANAGGTKGLGFYWKGNGVEPDELIRVVLYTDGGELIGNFPDGSSAHYRWVFIPWGDFTELGDPSITEITGAIFHYTTYGSRGASGVFGWTPSDLKNVFTIPDSWPNLKGWFMVNHP